MFYYLVCYTIYVKKDLLVGKSDYTITDRPKPGGTYFVILLLLSLGVISAIHLDYQPFVSAQEIDDIITDNVLA